MALLWQGLHSHATGSIALPLDYSSISNIIVLYYKTPPLTSNPFQVMYFPHTRAHLSARNSHPYTPQSAMLKQTTQQKEALMACKPPNPPFLKPFLLTAGCSLQWIGSRNWPHVCTGLWGTWCTGNAADRACRAGCTLRLYSQGCK